MESWLLVLLAVITVLVGILWFRLHAFLTLLLAGFIVAQGTSSKSLQAYATAQVVSGAMQQEDADALVETPAVKRLVRAFGATAGNIGIIIALAGVIGGCLMSSGAAFVIVDRSLALVGESRAAIALAASSFLLGIPVFFDTVFYLMVPLARSLRIRTGGNYVLYILAIMAGGSIAHSLVPPTPGPLQVADIIGVDIVTLTLAGLSVGALSSVLSLVAAYVIDRYVDVPLRDVDAHEIVPKPEVQSDLTVSASPPENVVASGAPKAAPPLYLALLPIILPILLISGASFIGGKSEILNPSLSTLITLLGDRNVALGLGSAAALYLLRWQPSREERGRVIGEAISSSGVVILITSAGGAFGAMLGQSNIAEQILDIGNGFSGIFILPIAFLLTAAIRTVQGSATVAMITSAGILQGFAIDDSLPFHPVYLVMAIGGGSKPIAWMTDSGFWIMCKMSGMTESEGLRTVSPLTIAMGLSTLFWTMIGAYALPLK